MDERRLRRLLRDAPLPDEDGARERGWRVVRAAFTGRERLPREGRRPVRLVLAVAAAASVLAIVLSPAGAKVADVFRDVTGIGKEKARPALSSLPAPGRLLVSSSQGVWVVNQDGSKRLLGDYDAATWSPHGLFVAATHGRELAAVEPGTGSVHWTISRGQITDPAWSPSGFRIAYRSGGDLRLVDGDGTADRLLARDTAAVTPAWRPLSREGRLVVEKGVEPPERLAFVDRAGRIHVIDPASAKPFWVSSSGPRPHQLLWTEDGTRLVAVGRGTVRIYGASGGLERSLDLPRNARAIGAAIDPSGRRLAIATKRPTRSATARSEIGLLSLRERTAKPRRLFSGPGRFSGLAWSPNGRWLLVAWHDADQGLFIPLGGGKVKAVGHLSQQFAPGERGPTSFPRLDGWCCAG